jgi:hypothetical protein
MTCERMTMDVADRNGGPASQPGNVARVSWRALALLLVIVSTAWRLDVIAHPSNLLVAEEAHYWEWSRRLDWGYYSKPPLIAWLIRLQTELGGNNAFSVRIGAVFIALALAALTWRFAQQLGLTPRGAFFSLLTLSVVPLFAAGSVTMTTDTPLMIGWAGALSCLWAATVGGRPRFWFATGIALGLGLLSKYTMAFFVPGMVLFLALTPTQRHWLRRPHPYLMTLAGIAFLGPTLWWTWSHGWVTFKHVAADAGVARGWRISPRETMEFLGSQIAVISPVIFGILVAVTAGALRRGRRPLTEAERFLLCMAMPVFFAYLLKSLQDKVQGNWAAVAYYPWILFAVSRLDAWGEACARVGRAWRPRALAAAALLPAFALTYALKEPHALGGATLRFQPPVRQGDWRGLARAVDDMRTTMPRPEKTLIIAREYQTAAFLAFYMNDQPVVFQAPSASRRMTQYDLWPGYEDFGGWDALYVRQGRKQNHVPAVAEHFTSCGLGREINIALPGTKDRIYTIFPCYGLQPSQVKKVMPTTY